ncbi:AbrB family transcriptional regulator, partial [Shigella flexneri]|nr:AbrB family transcriptional regulator [Shigella flexneri]
MLYRYTKEKIMRERRMPVLQWGMLCVLSLLLSIGFLAVHLPAALLLGPMIAGIIFSMRGITLQLPRSA